MSKLNNDTCTCIFKSKTLEELSRNYRWRKCTHCDNGFNLPLNLWENRVKCKVCDGFGGHWGPK